MKVSLIYGKRVLSTAGKTGYVISVNRDGNKLTCLVCADEDEKTFAVNINGIRNSKDKIIYNGGECAAVGVPLRLGMPAFDCEGNYLGKLTDMTVEKNVIVYAHIGNKKFSADDIVCGDVVIVKNSARILKSDVKKNGRIIIRRGTPLTPEILDKAQKKGEYVQANLKTI